MEFTKWKTWMVLLITLWLMAVVAASAAIASSAADVPDTSLVFTPQETQWLNSRTRIRIGAMDAWPPMNFLNHNGEPDGIGADYIREMNRLLDGRLKIVSGPFKANLEKVKQGDLDAIMDITPKPERKVYLHFTRVYLDIPHVMVGPKEGPYYKSETDLSGKIVALEEGFYNIVYFQKNFPDVTIRTYPNTSLALDAVVRGEADAYAGNRAVAAHIMEKELMATLKFHGRLNKPGSVLAMAVPKNLPELAGILDKTLGAIAEERKQAIRRKWAGLTVAADTVPNVTRTGDDAIRMGRGARVTDRIPLGITGVVVLAVVAAVFFMLVRMLRRESVAMSFGSPWFRGMVLVGLGVFILVVAGLGWLLMERTRGAVIGNTASNLKLVLSLIQDRTDMWLEERTALMKRLGKDPELVAITRRLLAVPPQKQALLASEALADARSFFRNSPDIFQNIGFFIISPDRISLGSMRDTNIGTRNLIADQYPAILDRAFQGEAGFVPPITSDVHLTGESIRGRKPPTMFFISPIQDLKGNILAAMTLRIDPVKDLSRLTRSPGRWKTDDLYAFDRSGRMLSSSRFEDQLRDMGMLGPNESSALTIDLRDPGGDMTRGYRTGKSREDMPLTRLAQQAVVLRRQMTDLGIFQGASAVGMDMDGYPDYRGVPVFGAWLWNRDLDVGLAVEIDKAEALEGFYWIRKTVFGILGGTLVLSVFSVLLVLVLGERARRVLETARDNKETKVAERTLELQENQERFAALLESAPDAMVVSDESGEIVLVNSETEKLFEYGRAELLGASVDLLVPETVRGSHHEKRSLYHGDENVRAKGAAGLELTAQSKSGTLIPVEISLSPIKNRSGILVVASIRDITERKEAEAALRASEESFRLILESVGDGIFGVDTEGCVTFVNPSAGRLLGYDTDELISRPIHDKIHHTHTDGTHYPVEDCPMFRAYSRGTRETISDEMLWRKDGTGFHVEYSAVPVIKDGRISGAVITFRDITERRAMEAVLAGEREQLQRILDTSPVGVAITTGDSVRFANPRFTDMFDVQEGDDTPDLYAEDADRDRIAATLACGRRIDNMELKMIGKNRRIRDMLVTYMPIDYQGETGGLGWIMDITDRKQAEQEIRDRLEELNRFRRLAVGRENKMIQLKKEINELSGRLGEAQRYKIVGKSDTGDADA
ncbi:MAG TPA: hypothetical protein DHV36_12840 [Desulfobacteraceae bacterium]|nr:hypothetical protein [Desulfobacteraceae bacterium]